MINYIHQFIIDNKRRPTETEVGDLMRSIAMSEPGRIKHEKIRAQNEKSKLYGSLGGQKKIPVNLSDNAMKINDLLTKKISVKDISLILDISQTTVKSIIRKKSLPRTKDLILNYKTTKWS